MVNGYIRDAAAAVVWSVAQSTEEMLSHLLRVMLRLACTLHEGTASISSLAVLLFFRFCIRFDLPSYDVTNRQSFDSTTQWIEDVATQCVQ